MNRVFSQIHVSMNSEIFDLENVLVGYNDIDP
jgi:hypothetical protein